MALAELSTFRFELYLRPPQSGVLLRCQPQVHPSLARFYGVFQRLLALQILPGFPASRQLANLVSMREGEISGQRCFQAGLQEPAMPPSSHVVKVK